MQIGVLLQTNQQISEFIMFYTRYVWWSFLVNLKVRFVAFECWNMKREKKNWRKSRKEKEANVCIKEEERAKPWRTKTETKSVLLMISLFRVRNSFFNMQNARCLKNCSESVQNVSPSFARSLSLSRIIITQKNAQTIRLLCAKFKFQTVICLEIMPYLYHWSMRCGTDFVAECFISLNERVIITKSIKSRRSKTFRFWIRFYFETMSLIGTDTFRCFITRVWIMMRFRFHINHQPRRNASGIIPLWMRIPIPL